MADTVRRVDYFSVTVPDAPGEGDRILSTLRDRSVNLLAYLGFPLEGGRGRRRAPTGGRRHRPSVGRGEASVPDRGRRPRRRRRRHDRQARRGEHQRQGRRGDECRIRAVRDDPLGRTRRLRTGRRRTRCVTASATVRSGPRASTAEAAEAQDRMQLDRVAGDACLAMVKVEEGDAA